MIDPEAYIDKGLVVVEQLVNNGDYLTALKACEDLLRVNPYHTEVQEYLRNIHTRIAKDNEAKVDHDIEMTMPLWQNHRYDELRTIYGKLLKYAPEHKKLRSLILKLQETVTGEAQKEQDEIKAKAITAINTLISQKQFEEAVAASGELTELFPLDKATEDIGKKARYALIDEKIRQNPQFDNNADFMAVEAFYESLLKIDPTHPDAKKRLERTREHDTRARMLDSKIHLNENVDRMKQLWATREYEKVIQSCEEILQQDPSNLTAKLYRSKAHSTLLRESDELETRQLKVHWKEVEELYQKDKTQFVKI